MTDVDLLTQAYYQFSDVIDATSVTFIEAAPDDPERQFSLQARLMVAVLARFMASLPGLTDDNALSLFNHALEGVRAYAASDPLAN